MTTKAQQARLDVVKRLQSAMTELEWVDYQELIVSLHTTLTEERDRIGVPERKNTSSDARAWPEDMGR